MSSVPCCILQSWHHIHVKSVLTLGFRDECWTTSVSLTRHWRSTMGDRTHHLKRSRMNTTSLRYSFVFICARLCVADTPVRVDHWLPSSWSCWRLGGGVPGLFLDILIQTPGLMIVQEAPNHWALSPAARITYNKELFVANLFSWQNIISPFFLTDVKGTRPGLKRWLSG